MSDNPARRRHVDFGFRQVTAAEKAGMVRAVFDSVAPRYDLMNDLMSLGIHRVWKQIFISDCNRGPASTLLDLAGGTGDISFGWLKRGGGPVLLTDINGAMLSVGRDRAAQQRASPTTSPGWSPMPRHLPLPDRCVDRVSIAFGLRNCTDKASRAARGPPRAEARRPLPVPGILPRHRRTR